jgi:hypothetical protein
MNPWLAAGLALFGLWLGWNLGWVAARRLYRWDRALFEVLMGEDS